MKDLYLESAFKSAELITKAYSTSFSSSVATLPKSMRPVVYAVYGMVRIADEIVDTPPPGIDISAELRFFEGQVHEAIDKRYSSNPILHAFQYSANTYGIKREVIDAFFVSMAMDLEKKSFTKAEYETYIHGSAEAVGLMCLSIFTDGDQKLYRELEAGARALGSVFQKVNFLRDVSRDYRELDRSYFPGVMPGKISETQKKEIERDISEEFDASFDYIARMPLSSRRGVYTAYLYYRELEKALRNVPAERLMQQRISVSWLKKRTLYIRAFLTYKYLQRNIKNN